MPSDEQPAQSREQVALLHDGRVLVDAEGRLPEFRADVEEDDDLLTRALALVGADIVVAPLVELADDRHLHLLGVRALPVPDGRWVDPAELDDQRLAEAVADAVRAYAGSAVPALRPEWFRPGWYDRVEEWVDAGLDRAGRRRTGAMEAVKIWSISAVLRIPTDGGVVWFKAAGEIFHAEPAIHRVLATHFTDDVPVLLAEDDDRAWLLMEDMPGAAETERVEGAALALAKRWFHLQLASLDLLDELRAAGCPVRGLDQNLADWRAVLAGSPELDLLEPEELAAVRAVADEVEDLLREFWACGLPDTLTHGDLHLGNVAYDGEALRVFDWTDACLSHPLIDAEHLAHFSRSRPRDPDLVAAFAEAWRAACPGAQVDRALQLAPVADLVFQADTFSRIVTATEARSRWELGGVVASILRKLPEAVAEAR